MDDEQKKLTPAQLYAQRKRPKLRASTLRRLTAIPQHKVRHDNRHFPQGATASGASSAFALLKGDAPARPSSADSDADPQPQESAQERRKRYLTMSNLKRVFKALDLSDDGYIDVDELHEAVSKLDKRESGKLSRSEIEDVIWEVDDDRDGKLSMADYLTSYRRTQHDEYGFEPKRFHSIVEFLLMDRDCSGEITLDEATTTIFERQGADNLKELTQDFFRAAGLEDSDTDPPPGTTITFGNYYEKVGCAKPKVPSIIDVRKTYSTRLFTETFGHPPAPLRPSTSAGLLPRLLNPPSRPQSVANPLASSRSSSGLLSANRPASLSPLSGGARSPGHGRPASVGNLGGGRRPLSVGGSKLNSMKRTQSGGIVPLKPMATNSSTLALSALAKVGQAEKVTNYKKMAAGALKLDSPPRGSPGGGSGGPSLMQAAFA